MVPDTTLAADYRSGACLRARGSAAGSGPVWDRARVHRGLRRAALLRLGGPARERPGQGPQRGDQAGQGRLRAGRDRAAAHRLPRADHARGRAGRAAGGSGAGARRGCRHFGQPRHRRAARPGPAGRRSRYQPPRTGTRGAMNPLRVPAAARFALAAAAAPALAQGGVEPMLASCAAIEAAAPRLVCYDDLARRSSPGPHEADLAAARAREAIQAGASDGEAGDLDADRGRTDELFVHDEAIGRALANAGRGSLLDSRWELARDSKLGIFNFRVHKPVYLMPAFWTSRVNDMPSSANPDNTVREPMGLDSLETKFQISFKTK